MNFKIQIGKNADIGNNREQQDDMIVIQKPEINCTILGVADGHGRQLGKLAANTCKTSVEEFTDANMELLDANPTEFLEKCYDFVQDRIRDAFVQTFLTNEFDVKVEEGGYIIKRRYNWMPFLNTSGGSMLTIAIIKNGILYMSNVGDCDAGIFTPTPITMGGQTDHADQTNTQILTFDHSPKSVEEYTRIRGECPSEEDPTRAKLLFVYDDVSKEAKSDCPSVFGIAEDGTPSVIKEAPHYVKNVKNDPAIYVTSPADARFKESVASTRTMGDFFLNTYGVSAKPQIMTFDLAQCLEQTDTACLVIASDGVWDVWINDHVNKFVMDPSCLRAVTNDLEMGAQKVADAFIKRTVMFGQKYFKGNADNASAIVAYFTKVLPQVESVFAVTNTMDA